jgi:hypothetical protein
MDRRIRQYIDAALMHVHIISIFSRNALPLLASLDVTSPQ